MEEELKSAQTTASEQASVAETGKDADPGRTAAEVNDTEFTDTENGGNDQPAAEPEKKPEQTAETNAQNARRRREAERQAAIDAAKDEARQAAILEALDHKNPYTGEPMTDKTDIDEYLAMKEIAKNGGDPVGDYSKYLKQKERDKAKEAEKKKADESWFIKDREEFTNTHPGVNVDQLSKDKRFLLFAEGKIGNKPLSEIYDGYLQFTGEAEKAAQAKAAQTLANKKASPGSLATSGESDNGFFTKEQVQSMTPAEVHKNFDKIRKSMERWKNE